MDCDFDPSYEARRIWVRFIKFSDISNVFRRRKAFRCRKVFRRQSHVKNLLRLENSIITQTTVGPFACNLRRGDPMKYWEIIADNLSKAGWSWGGISTVDSEGRRIWIVDAHRGDGNRFVVRVTSSRRDRTFFEAASQTAIAVRPGAG